MAVDEDGDGAEPDGRRVSRPKWLVVGIFSWLVIVIVLNELLDPPFDPVRVLVRMVLAGLMTWFVARILTTSRRHKA